MVLVLYITLWLLGHFIGHCGCHLVYIKETLTLADAWTRCHGVYGGQLGDKNDWMNRTNECANLPDKMWYGSFFKVMPWISYEGCYGLARGKRGGHTRKTSSVAACQQECGVTPESYFATGADVCLCNVQPDALQRLNTVSCNKVCDGSLLCTEKGYVTLYKNVNLTVNDDYDESSNFNLCLGFKCSRNGSVGHCKRPCEDKEGYICENDQDEFHRRRSWKDANNYCFGNKNSKLPETGSTSICQEVKQSLNIPRWTSVMRTTHRIKDNGNVSLRDIENLLNDGKSAKFYILDERANKYVFDANTLLPSICDTDEIEIDLFEGDSICSERLQDEAVSASPSENRFEPSRSGHISETTNAQKSSQYASSVSVFQGQDSEAGFFTDDSSVKMKMGFFGMGYGLDILIGAGALALVLAICIPVHLTLQRSKNKRLKNSESRSDVHSFERYNFKDILSMQANEKEMGMYNSVEYEFLDLTPKCISDDPVYMFPCDNGKFLQKDHDGRNDYCMIGGDKKLGSGSIFCSGDFMYLVPSEPEDEKSAKASYDHLYQYFDDATYARPAKADEDPYDTIGKILKPTGSGNEDGKNEGNVYCKTL